ncbi:FG-GAP and VCBS repeat-containing protein [Streptomyces daliensis]|uniref:FG-GAP repeat protein n=1 Tax=Streptomyces daliensis TaxID=299421 RepID=A0A8T4IMH3_9ACTN|nr:FG-GAP repeat protein [Streptomyces daliensis]
MSALGPAAVVVLVAGGLTAVTAPSAHSAPRTVTATAAGAAAATEAATEAATARAGSDADFNGDGYGDLVVGTPKAEAPGQFTGGAVTVTYGSASGVSPARSVTLGQDSPSVPGAGESGDEFGESTASGDVDGDGYADLVVGAPGERLADGRGGMVTVLWGGPKGLAYGGTPVTSPRAYDQDFGEGVAVADLDGDAGLNIAVVSRANAWYVPDGFGREDNDDNAPIPAEGGWNGRDARAQDVVAADVTGSGSAGLVAYGWESDYGPDWTGYFTCGAAGLAFDSDLIERDGIGTGTRTAAATGDIDGDGIDDLVTGDRFDGAGGTVTIRYGAPGGPGTAREPVTIGQDSPGVPGADEPNDWFGASVSVGDVTGDGYADLAVGVERENVDGVTSTGAAVLLKGSAKGLATSGNQSFHQATSGVPGVPEEYDYFGSAVHLSDVSGDGRADLAVSARGEDVVEGSDEDGGVWVLRGASGGLTTQQATSFSAPRFGLGFAGRQFGSVLPD